MGVCARENARIWCACITGTAALTCGQKGERSAMTQARCVRSNTGCLELMRLHHGVRSQIMAMAWKSIIYNIKSKVCFFCFSAFSVVASRRRHTVWVRTLCIRTDSDAVSKKLNSLLLVNKSPVRLAAGPQRFAEKAQKADSDYK